MNDMVSIRKMRPRESCPRAEAGRDGAPDAAVPEEGAAGEAESGDFLREGNRLV